MDEYLDIINDEDIVTGQEMRSIVHQLGLQHRGAHVFLFTQDGKLLIQKRSKERAQYPSAWDCSVSEHVKAGESPYDAAVRGIQEEIGLTGIKIRPVIKFKMTYGPNDNEISTIYRGVIEPGDVKFDSAEIEAVEYIRVEDLIRQMDNVDRIFCDWFIQIVRWSQGRKSALQVLRSYSLKPLFRNHSRLKPSPRPRSDR